MSVRLSGGLGPLRVSVPLLPRGRRRGRSRSSGGGAALLTGIGMLMWWMILYGVIWPARLLYWELPKVMWRGCQGWQARRRLAASTTPPSLPPTP